MLKQVQHDIFMFFAICATGSGIFPFYYSGTTEPSGGSNGDHLFDIRMSGFGELVYTLKGVHPETQEFKL
jgi:hypothetical protein